MAALKYWDGTQWQTLASAAQDTLEWIDLGLSANYVVATAPATATVPFTNVKGSNGLTANSSGQIVVSKAGVYHVVSSVSLATGSTYVVTTLRQWRGGAVIQQREVVPALQGGGWDTGTVVGNFDAQVGDLFEIIASGGVASQQIEATRAQFTAHRLSGPGTVQALNAATVSVELNAGAGWPTAAPGPTSGTAFTTPAGVLRATATASAFNSANTPIAVDCYIDGVFAGSMRMSQTLTTNAHMALAPTVFTVNVTAGTHYVYFRQVGGQSGTSDYGTFFGIVTSASGQLTDAATVLNLRKVGTQALTAATWTTITGWGVQHAYPVWAAENAGVFTIPTDGYYRCEIEAAMTSLTGLRSVRVLVNGSNIGNASYPADSAGATAAHYFYEGNFRAGDTVAFQAYSAAASSIIELQADGINGPTRAIIRKIYSGGIPAGQGAPDIPWTALALVNSWTNYGANFTTAAYRRINGIVYLRGLIANGTISTITTLPVGCRPSATHLLPVMTNANYGRVDISSDGSVVAVTPSTNGWLSLSGLTFPADQ